MGMLYSTPLIQDSFSNLSEESVIVGNVTENGWKDF